MDLFTYRNGELYVEDLPVRHVAEQVGTPCFVYSRGTLEEHYDRLVAAFAPINPLVCYSVKSCGNLGVLRALAARGAGMDVVSGGELARAQAAGVPASKCVYAGVGKTDAEIVAAIHAGIGLLNCESEAEFENITRLAAQEGTTVRVALRINPDVDAGTHGKISTGKADNKFGVGIHRAPGIYARLSTLPNLHMRGVALHIGSQLTSLEPLETAFEKVGVLLQELRAAGHVITHVDLGGGLGVRYREGDNPPEPAEYGAMVARVTKDWGVRLMFEPGRIIAGNAGVLLTRVIRVKPGAGNAPFVIVDAAMNDLARPALYDAWHDFEAVAPNGQKMMANIVGPVCETGDTFAMGREIDPVVANDLAIFRTAGAYGATMASTYNSRGLVPEVLVDGDRFAVVAERISPETILAAEHVPDWLK